MVQRGCARGVVSVALVVLACAAAAIAQPLRTPRKETLDAEKARAMIRAALESQSRGEGLRGPNLGDTCGAPIPIVCGGSGQADFFLATADAADPPFPCRIPTAGPGFQTVWFSFVATQPSARISTCGSGGDTMLAVFGGTCGALTLIDCNDDSNACTGLQSVVNATGLTPDETYLVLAARYSPAAASTIVTVSLTCPGNTPPANDCATATVIPAVPSPGTTISAPTTAANSTGDDPVFACLAGGARGDGTLWYQFTATAPTALIETCPSTAGDSVLAVFEGTCESPSIMACNDDTCSQRSQVRLNGLQIGQAYLVQVATRTNPNAARTDFSLKLQCPDPLPPPPVNDQCTGAIALAVPSSGAYTNAGASADTVPTCNGLFAATSGVWFTLVGNGSVVTVSTCGAATTFDTRLFAFTAGASCWDLKCVNANAAASPPCTPASAATISFCTAPGQTYSILVATDAGTATGVFALTVSAGAPCAQGDLCTSAISLDVPGTSTGTTAGMTADLGAPACGGLAAPVNGAWFSFRSPGGQISLTTCDPGTSINTRLSVYDGDCGSLQCLGSNSDAVAPPCGANGGASTVNFCSIEGQRYFVLVASEDGSAGAFTLRAEVLETPCVPPNDTISGAADLAIPSLTPADTRFATPDAAAPSCLGVSPAGGGLWYRIIGNGRTLTASTCASPIDTRLSVYCGNPESVSTLTCVASSESGLGCSAGAARVTWCAENASTYFLLLHGPQSGALSLSLLDGSPCSPTISCARRGACCTGAACALLTRAQCAGVYLGDGTFCSYGSASPDLPIPDGSGLGVASSISIPAGADTITDLDVSLLIQHSWQGDVRVTLQHDAGAQVVLIDRPGYPQTSFGFSADNFGNPTTGTMFRLDDSAAARYDNPSVNNPGINNVSGSWQPDTGPLAAFTGQSLSGTWTLRVFDLASGDTGLLRSWSLTPSPPSPPVCATGPDCFSRTAQPVGSLFVAGGANGVPDSLECVADWDRDLSVDPADIAAFVNTWLASLVPPGTTWADIDCNGLTEPADIAAFVNIWLGSITPGHNGCP